MNASVRKRVRAVGDYQRASLACCHLYDGARVGREGKCLESVDDFILPKLLSARVEKYEGGVRISRSLLSLLVRSLRKPSYFIALLVCFILSVK